MITFYLKNRLHNLKMKNISIFIYLFILLISTNNYAYHQTRDTIPTPRIITNLKENFKKVFHKHKNDSLRITQKNIKDKTVKTKENLKTALKETKNDTIQRILEKNVKQKFWTTVNKPGILLTQTSFLNWSKGGNNTIAGIVSFKGDYNYKKGSFFWRNGINLKYGLSKENGEENSRKTDDVINLKSGVGYKTAVDSKWYYSGDFSLATQFGRGYKGNDKERKTPISNFFAPARMRIGLGAVYTDEDDNFKFQISPLTNQVTFVLDQELANNGAFGVDKATKDDDGNIIKEGKNINSEFGTLISIEYKTKLMKNINFALKSSFYTDYLDAFGNIDSDVEVTINMKVNQFINSKISSHLLYDDDAQITDKNGNQIGARVQLKQILGVGVTYVF